MKRFFSIIAEITMDAVYDVAYFVKSNVMSFITVSEVIFPYIMYFIGQNKATIGFEIAIPIVFAVLVHYIKAAANKMGKGVKVPIPDKRFTQVDDDGEVTIENDRLQELILYMADLEDWFERRGVYKSK